MESKKYKIIVILANAKTLTYHVDTYEVLEGGFIRFIDPWTGKIKRFDGRSCEIEEVQKNG